MSEIREFHKGDIVRHFKRETVDSSSKQYLYEIIGEGMHTETHEKLMIYKSVADNKIYARPYEMFISEVDHEKYPNIKQKYRMVVISKNDLPNT